MHGLKLLHKRLLNSRVRSHKNRLNALMKTVGGLLCGGQLTLTHLGRSLSGAGYEKHKIKCVDRLLGNHKLHGERKAVYRQMAHWLLCRVSRPIIVVDGSDVYEGQAFVMLTAAIPLSGRALTLYEDVYPMKQYNSPKAHKRFLKGLSEVVPENTHPIIVTDAGFRGPGFRAVEKLGWDWVGRLRKGINYTLNQGETWQSVSRLYRQASYTMKYIGQALLTMKQPYKGQLYLVKKNLKGHKRPLRRRGDNVLASTCRKLYRDPWLLATSLPHGRGATRQIEKIYSLRMQIEETFRDIKNGRWGRGMEYARSVSNARLENRFLIGTLGTFVLWFNGVVASTKGWAKHFPANTEKRYTVLSLLFLGKRLLNDKRFQYGRRDMTAAFREISNMIHEQVNFVGIS